ncbi:MAG: GDP-mannose 4,6-dehydratase, partial [Elusimicrobia bacterium]|nr:GDP-mannose 4,6-dehydratase [Elusimicrobiota bacterium]
KRFAEAMTIAYHRYHKVAVRIVRIFNTYGPRMRLNDGRAVPNFVTQALEDRPITVYGDGTQTRSLCYVSDLVNGIYKVLLSNLNQPVNIGNPEEIKLIDLAKTIKILVKSKSRIQFKPLPVDDPKVRCPDIRLASTKLHWSPKIKLQEGLKKTIPYFRAALKG